VHCTTVSGVSLGSLQRSTSEPSRFSCDSKDTVRCPRGDGISQPFFMQVTTPPRSRRRPQPGDPWHLEAVFLTIHGERHALGRAVDQDDNVLDSLGQSRRNTHAAQKVFRTLLKGLTYGPRVLITDKLQSYGAAKRESLPGVEHRQSRYRNARCENAPRPTRQRAYRMQGFTAPGHA
jgi:transposase-like protein